MAEIERVTDNFHPDFPARMSDGRFMTDHRTNCILNTLELSKKNNSNDTIKFLFKTKKNDYNE